MNLGAARVLLSLARWLGPWAGTRTPGAVTRTEVLLESHGRRVRVYRYEPRDAAPLGAYLLAPGLHFLGPADPRLDRFARVLARAGLLVDAPMLPDHAALRIAPRSADDLAVAFDSLEAHARVRGVRSLPALFSISFGSQPSLMLAARDSHAARVGALVLFGGYGDFGAIVRFCVTGRHPQGPSPYDPLNAPLVWLNLLPELASDYDTQLVDSAWHTIIERTWGRPELKADGARDHLVHALGDTLPARERGLFLLGCGLADGAAPLLERCLAQAGSRFDFADPRPLLPRVRAPVVLVHGRDDDVIPWSHSVALREGLAPGHPHRLLLTGLYDHSGSALPPVREALRELRTMGALLRSMRDAALAPEQLFR